MRKSVLFYLVILLSFTLLLAACGGGSDETESDSNTESDGNTESSSDDLITLKLINDAAEGHPQAVGSNLFKELVEERLDGKVEVEVYNNSSLFDIDEGLEALQAGNIHIVSGSTAKLVGYDQAYQLFDVPFLFSSTDELRRFYESEAGQDLKSRVEDHGLKILDIWFGTFKQMTNSKHPITSPEDMEGLKFRVMAGGLLEDQFTTLGAGATVIPFSELYMSLQQGVIDGQENTFTEIATSKLYEVQDYMTITNHALASYPFITNKEFWEGLPEDIRTELEAILSEVTEEVAKVTEEIDQTDYKTIEESGIEIVDLTDEEREEFKEALQPLYDEYKDVIGADLMDAAINFE